MQMYVKQKAKDLGIAVKCTPSTSHSSEQAKAPLQEASSTTSSSQLVETPVQGASSSTHGGAPQPDLTPKQAANQEKYNGLPAVRVLRNLEAERKLMLVAVSAESSTGTFNEPGGYNKQQPVEFEGRQFTVPYTFTAFSFIDLVTPAVAVPVQVLFPVCDDEEFRDSLLWL
jgi:hypothetical protein